MKRLLPALIVCFISTQSWSVTPEPRELIQQAMDHWRSSSSYSEITMTIHRPDWQRSMSMRSWTLGDKNSLHIFVSFSELLEFRKVVDKYCRIAV